MGWFSHDKKEQVKPKDVSIPKLPKLPELPEFSDLENTEFDDEFTKLPSIPSNSFGERFSQNAIKDAVSGQKENGELFETDDFAENDLQMMSGQQKRTLTRELPENFQEDSFEKTSIHRGVREIPESFKGISKSVRKADPIFIRIDKFEESLKIFEKSKSHLLDIEKMLSDIKKIKYEEEKELINWENEIQSIKAEIEKVDNEIFSKIE